MKKFIATFVLMAMVAIMLPLTATAQTRRNYNSNRTNSSRTNSNRTYTNRNYEKPGVYDKHRNLINIGIGAGAGTLLGALIGGRKGALIGAAAGAGGSALYTYKINPKDKRNYRRYR